MISTEPTTSLAELRRRKTLAQIQIKELMHYMIELGGQIRELEHAQTKRRRQINGK